MPPLLDMFCESGPPLLHGSTGQSLRMSASVGWRTFPCVMPGSALRHWRSLWSQPPPVLPSVGCSWRPRVACSRSGLLCSRAVPVACAATCLSPWRQCCHQRSAPSHQPHAPSCGRMCVALGSWGMACPIGAVPSLQWTPVGLAGQPRRHQPPGVAGRPAPNWHPDMLGPCNTC